MAKAKEEPKNTNEATPQEKHETAKAVLYHHMLNMAGSIMPGHEENFAGSIVEAIHSMIETTLEAKLDELTSNNEADKNAS